MTPKIFARDGGQETGKSTLSTVKKKSECAFPRFLPLCHSSSSFFLFLLPSMTISSSSSFAPFFLFFLNGCVLLQFFTIDRYRSIDSIYDLLLFYFVSSIFSRRCNRVSLRFPLFRLRLLFSYRRYRDYTSARISKPIDIDRTLLHIIILPATSFLRPLRFFFYRRTHGTLFNSMIRSFRERLFPLGLPIVEFFRRISFDIIKS